MFSTHQVHRFEVSLLDIPLFAPFGISGGAQAVANNVLVTLTLADGTTGYGEAAPLPPYNGETQADAFAGSDQQGKGRRQSMLLDPIDSRQLECVVCRISAI